MAGMGAACALRGPPLAEDWEASSTVGCSADLVVGQGKIVLPQAAHGPISHCHSYACLCCSLYRGPPFSYGRVVKLNCTCDPFVIVVVGIFAPMPSLLCIASGRDPKHRHRARGGICYAIAQRSAQTCTTTVALTTTTSRLGICQSSTPCDMFAPPLDLGRWATGTG